MRLVSSVLVALALGPGAGCASLASGQRAPTLGKGRYEVGLETSYRASLERDTVRAFPMMSVAARLGLTDRLDAGLRAGSAGLGAQVKVQLYRSADERMTWSVAPQMDWVHAYDRGVGLDTLETAVPLLGTLVLRPDLELTLSPRIHSSLVQVVWSDRATLHTLGVGGGVGLGIRGSRAWVMPEIGLLWPFLVTGQPADEMGGTTTDLDRVIAQLSLTVIWEGGR